jgi:acyl carrier protein
MNTVPIKKTRLFQRAEKFGKVEEKFDVEEKKKPEVKTFWGFELEESESKFRRRISLDLVRKVNEILKEEPIVSGEKEEIPQEPPKSIEEKIKDIILKYSKVKREELTLDADFTRDLGVDSLETIEMVMDSEEEFGIEIPDEDAEKLNTVGKAIEYIKRKLKEKEESQG